MEIIVLANTVLVKGGISGGDIVLPYINKYWGGRFKIKVMTTTQGRRVWESIGSNAEFILLPHMKYEERELKFTFLFTYIIRTIFAALKLSKMLHGRKEGNIVLSASDFFPDVLPACLLKGKGNFWVARVYHLIKSPSERKGNPLLNILSFLLQRASLAMIRAKADLILTPIGTYKELCALGFDKERIFINNPGVDLQKIDSVRPSDRHYDAIFIGALLHNKGSYDIVNIWNEVTKKIRDAKLVVIGGGPKKEVEDFKKMIEERGLGSHIEYLGFVRDIEDVYTRLKSSRVLILTGHENGWSIPVSEAFACGIPVVAYNLKMFGTAFKRGFISVPLYDTGKFAEEIINLLEDDKLRAELSKEAYSEGRGLGWDKVSQGLGIRLEAYSIERG
ncbi:MAG: glycosyltransferase [Candidatus Omnitrophota bacterium]